MDFLREITEEEIAKAKEDHEEGALDLREYILDDNRVFQGIFKKPSTAAFQRYLDMSGNQKREGAGAIASRRYVLDCIVTPIEKEYLEIVKDLPALTIQIANDLSAGMGLTVESKKKQI